MDLAQRTRRRRGVGKRTHIRAATQDHSNNRHRLHAPQKRGASASILLGASKVVHNSAMVRSVLHMRRAIRPLAHGVLKLTPAYDLRRNFADRLRSQSYSQGCACCERSRQYEANQWLADRSCGKESVDSIFLADRRKRKRVENTHGNARQSGLVLDEQCTLRF